MNGTLTKRALGQAAATAGLSRQPLVCLICQQRQPQWLPSSRSSHDRRGIATTPARAAKAEKPGTGASLNPQSTVKGPVIEAPRSYGKRVEGDFVPQPLPRPIGMQLPPSAGENTGIDSRTLQQRRDDFVNYDKHLARRKELTAQIAKPYFRDWGNLKYHEGKSFIAPPRLFKAEMSLFFPNFFGQTLLKSGAIQRDTTPVLAGKASVVSFFSSQWAERQVETFASKAANPALHELVDRSGGLAQVVSVNYEDNSAKAWLVRMFMGSLRRKVSERDWDKYFLVRGGVTDEIRESIGLLNSKVGYTYLVDQHCRIRWAASGTAHPDEVEGMNKGLARMVEAIKKEATLPAVAREQPQGRRTAGETVAQ